MDRMEDLPQNVLVLGATSAIAEATMRILARHGTAFYLVARDGDKLAAVRSNLLTLGAVSVTVHVADLNDTSAHPSLLRQAANVLGTIDMALLAHGVLGEQQQAQAEYASAEIILRTNFLSYVSLITWLANYFEGAHRGVLAVISSVAGDRGRKSNYVYGASKGGLNVYLEGVRNRIDRSGVHVLTIKPGFIATPMTAQLPKNPLFLKPSEAGKYILQAVARRKDVAYIPPFWAFVMLVIRSIPRSIFKKMNL